jgi:hypothetical protein
MLYKRNIIPQQRVFHLNGKIKGKRPGGSSSSFVQRVIYVFFIVLLLLFIIPLYVILEGEYGPSFTVWNPIDSVSSSSLSEKEGRRGDSSNSNLLPKTQDLPIWIQEYMTWHREMRNKYQGKAIIEDINAPPVLVRTCLGLCGGLHDRLGQLPLDLYLAYKTKRVLLLKWIKPQPLGTFNMYIHIYIYILTRISQPLLLQHNHNNRRIPCTTRLWHRLEIPTRNPRMGNQLSFT